MNIFNTVNYDGYNDYIGYSGNKNSMGGDNPNLNVPNHVAGSARSFKLTARYRW